jgi:hypothetical protein
MTRLRTPSRPPPSKLEEATVRAIYRTFLGGAVLTVAALAALLIVSGGWQPVGAAVAILGGSCSA